MHIPVSLDQFLPMMNLPQKPLNPFYECLHLSLARVGAASAEPAPDREALEHLAPAPCPPVAVAAIAAGPAIAAPAGLATAVSIPAAAAAAAALASLAATAALRGDNRFSRHYEKMISEGVDKAMAKRTVARKILATALAILKSGSPYDERVV